MGHQISEVDEIAWTGKKPWHELGVEVPGLMRTDDAMRAAKLDWTVAKVPMITAGYTDEVSGKWRQGGLSVPDYYATVREDTKEVLGVVSYRYEVFQNWQMFDFIDALLREKLAVVEVCGSLRRGRHVWALMRLPGHIRVNQTDDVSRKYLLLTNSHDGSTGFRALFTMIRVVCWNTLTLALGGRAREGVTLRHTGDMSAKVDEARSVLGIANEHYDRMGEVVDRLGNCTVTDEEVQAFLKGLFPIKDTADDRWKRIVERQRTRVKHLFESGTGQDMKGIKHSAWALVNAVTEYVDWRENAPRLRGFRAGESRLYSAWFGSGVDLKERAFRKATELLNGRS